MKNNTFTVMKKECKRIFSDRKLFFTSVVLPGLLLFVMYSFIGTFMGQMFSVEDTYVYQVHAVNMPDSIAEIMSEPELRIEITDISEDEIEGVKQKISERETDLLLVFPPQFDEIIADFEPLIAAERGIDAPNIQMWANFARTESGKANNIVTALLNNYHHNLTHRFTINAPSDAAPEGDYNLASDADMFAMVLGMLIPLLFIIFIFTGCQSIAPESIAGEKERGTLGSILVTPANRRDIALGKILGVAVFSLMSAVVSILGAVLAMPGMMGLESGSIFDFYSVTDFALLLLVASSTTLVFVSLLSVLSAYAKSVKEATAYAMPIMLVVFVAGLAGMAFDGTPTEIIYYLFPVINSSLSISAIFSFEVSVLNVLTTAAVNIAVALIFTVVLAKIFSSEKIVFDK